MKKLLFIFSIAAVVLSACNKPNNNIVDPDDPNAPRIDLPFVGNFTLSPEAGTDTIFYDIKNPVDGGKLVADASGAEWITDIDCSVDGQVVFSYAENNTPDGRSTIFNLRYQYDGKEVLKDFNLIQTTDAYTYYSVMNNCTILYMGDLYTDYPYWGILIAENPPVIDPESGEELFGLGATYAFGAFSSFPSGELVPPSGEYNVTESGMMGTIHPDVCYRVDVIDDSNFTRTYFKEGTVNLSIDGENIVIEAVLTDINDETHKVIYNGSFEVEDASFMSDLEEDKTLEFDNTTTAVLAYYADWYEIGTANWTCYIMPDSTGGDYLQLEFLAPISATYDQGLPAGPYKLSDMGIENTLIPGNSYYGGSWWFQMIPGSDNEFSSAAPFTSGSVEVTINGNEYTFKIDVEDDATTPHKITGSWTGTPVLIDEATSTTTTKYSASPYKRQSMMQKSGIHIPIWLR